MGDIPLLTEDGVVAHKCGAGVRRFNNFKIAREYIAVTNSKAFVRIGKEVYAQDK
jgi:hypothetical protein